MFFLFILYFVFFRSFVFFCNASLGSVHLGAFQAGPLLVGKLGGFRPFMVKKPNQAKPKGPLRGHGVTPKDSQVRTPWENLGTTKQNFRSQPLKQT